MSQKFCHNCGKKAEPTWKACPYCTTSFASLTERPQPVAPPRSNRPLPQHNEETFAVTSNDPDEMYLDRLQHYQTNLAGLDVELQKPVQQKETIGQVVTNPFGGIDAPRTPPPQVSREEFLQQFQNEAGGPLKKIEIN